MGLPGVPRVPISGPNRGMFSKLNDPGPLGPGGLSHTIFGNGRFQGSQRSFGCGVLCLSYSMHTCPLKNFRLALSPMPTAPDNRHAGLNFDV